MDLSRMEGLNGNDERDIEGLQVLERDRRCQREFLVAAGCILATGVVILLIRIQLATP